MKWIISIFTFFLLSSICFGQNLKRQEFNFYPVSKENFALYSKEILIIPQQKSEKPPIIETASNFDGELDIGNHKWEEIPVGSNQWYSQKYWDYKNKTSYRYQKPKIEEIKTINNFPPPIIQSPVYNEIIPYQPIQQYYPQLQYFAPPVQQSFGMSFGGSSGRSC